MVLVTALVSLIGILAAIHPARAVLPPDLIFSMGSSFTQLFSFLFLMFSSAVGPMVTFFRQMWTLVRFRRLWQAIGVMTILAVFSGGYIAYVEGTRQLTSDEEVLVALREQVRAAEAESPTGQPSRPDEERQFFKQNQALPFAVPNEELAQLLRLPETPYVLDAREDEEYELGHLPGTKHVRFADLLEGAWQSLPADRVVYVLCYTGLRGLAVTEYLRSKEIVARYVQEGVEGWVLYGGSWEGETAFATQDSGSHFSRMYTTGELRQTQAQGTVIVDSRPKEEFRKWSIPGSVNIPVLRTPTSKMAAALAQVPPGAPVIAACNNRTDCFDAYILAIKLVRLGHPFLGRYDAIEEFRETYP